ncbi:hypothetical protein IT570_12040 [Candidatus Sumerlaeota bacterium]|nr:hypothetical protein [Candidatus Sumerlaeota bacterium]
MSTASPQEISSDLVTITFSRRRAELVLQLLVFIGGVLLCAHYLRHEFDNPYSIAGDVAQHSYWMVKYHDGALFRNEFYSTYARSLSTPGLEAIYWVGTLAASPQRVGKTLSVIIFGLTGWLFYLIGKAIHNHATGFLMLYLWLGFPNHTDEIDGGLHRSFAFPLLALFVYLLAKRRMGWIPWLMAVGLLIYPPAVLMMVAALPIFALFDWKHTRGLFRGSRALSGWCAVIAAALVVYTMRQLFKPDFLGPMMTGQEMAEDPRFTIGGRSPYLPFETLWNTLRVYAFNSNEPMIGFCAWILLLVPIRLLQGRRLLREIAPFLALGLASIALFELAKAIHFRLYIPRRYLQFSPVIVGAAMLALAAAAVLPFLRWKWLQAVLVLAVIGLIMKDSQGDYQRFFKDGKYDQKGASGLFRHLRKETPKDALIAASPKFSDAISVFASRATLLKYELSHPWYKNYRAEIEQRARDYYALVYAHTADDIRPIRDKYGIDYFILDPAQYDKKKRHEARLFYEPLNSELLRRYPLDRPESDYFMERLAAKADGFQWDRFEVIPLDEKTLSSVDAE